MIRPSRKILLLVSALLTASAPAFSATPGSGTLAGATAPVNWSGGPYTAVATDTSSCTTLNCDTFYLSVNTPAKFFTTNPTDEVQIRITWQGATNEFDLYLFDPSGNLLASSVQAFETYEEIDAGPLPNGTYKLVIVASQTVNVSYSGTAQIAADPTVANGKARYQTGKMIFGTPFELPRPNDPANSGTTLVADQDVEPRVVHDALGNLYVAAIQGVPGGVDVWKSYDTGKSFTYLGQPDGTQVVATTGTTTGVGLGGGDEDLAVGTSGNVYMNSLWLGSTTQASSYDGGNAWAVNPLSSDIPGDDRQWIASYGNNVLYLTYKQLGADLTGTVSIVVVKSSDGGITFPQITQVTTPVAGVQPGDQGNIVVDPRNGNVYNVFFDQTSTQVYLALVCTTVLAFQHFETFKQRFGPFPVTIEMISRFRNPKQQKEILQKAETGKIDILIGTHRILSKDLKFADLGLLIVDEEQRFGVRHKERIKQMRKQVDVLTMSATPIPRTLHMSLVGLRDMSVIETPPKDRMAIQTVVASWDDKLIQSALEQELERGGQVYFVHNRVDSIWEIAAKLQELVPKAKIIVGHGQMGEAELEKVMLGFMHHEADILVATTIIENGLDIPLCNTILINRADRLGLSELYQLRGRVGRSNRRAYAYLLIPKEVELTPIARRRLAALKEFSDLGAGFKIAALDLELRGAGNLLGGEQSGHIEAIGFELYTQMLERAVREMKGESAPDEAETQLNLGLNIRINSDYIPEENQRLQMYKRVARVETESQLADVAAELTDRYGPPPAPVRNLLDYASLKLLCMRVGVNAIERKRDFVTFKFRQNAAVDPEQLARFVSAQRGAQFTPDGMLKFALKATAADEVLRALRTVLEQLATIDVASLLDSSLSGNNPQ